MKIVAGPEGSVLYEHRRLAGNAAARDFAAQFPAESFGPEHRPVEAVRGFHVSGRPLLCFRPDLSAVVVDASDFPDGLSKVDATCMTADQIESPGRVTSATLAALGGPMLTRFLILAHVIETWAHLGSELELTYPVDGAADGFVGTVSGTHRYVTNEEIEEAVSFRVEVDAEGTITLTGLRP